MKLPKPGQIYVRHQLEDEESSPGLGERLLAAMRLKSGPPQLVALEFRQIVECRVGVPTVFYAVPDSDRFYAAWMNEWLEWQDDAHLLNPDGEPLPAETLIALIGRRDLPTFSTEGATP